jgi:hypothetical protein
VITVRKFFGTWAAPTIVLALILSPPFVAIFQNLALPIYWRPCAGPQNLGWQARIRL